MITLRMRESARLPPSFLYLLRQTQPDELTT